MKTKTLLLIAFLCSINLNVFSQTDAEFYKGADKKGGGESIHPSGSLMLSVGTFYGWRNFTFSEKDSSSDEDIKISCKNLVGISVTGETKLFYLEANVGKADKLTLLSGRVGIGGSLIPRKRFQVMLHGCVGYSYNHIDDDNLEKKDLGSLDFGVRLRTKLYVTNKVAVFAGGNIVLSSISEAVYNNKKMKANAGTVDFEVGVSISLNNK